MGRKWWAPNLSSALRDLDLWPPHSQSWSFHVLSSRSTCVNLLHQNRFICRFTSLVSVERVPLCLDHLRWRWRSTAEDDCWTNGGCYVAEAHLYTLANCATCTAFYNKLEKPLEENGPKMMGPKSIFGIVWLRSLTSSLPKLIVSCTFLAVHVC